MAVPTMRDDQWNELVEESGEPVFVMFRTQTCSVCATMEPVVERMAASLEGKVRVYKVDADASQGLAMRYGVQGVPTFMMFCHGTMVSSMVGEVYPALLERMAKEAIEFGGKCAATSTKVVYEMTGYF